MGLKIIVEAPMGLLVAERSVWELLLDDYPARPRLATSAEEREQAARIRAELLAALEQPGNVLRVDLGPADRREIMSRQQGRTLPSL